MKQQTGLVSVIIPCYNQARYLGESLQSVFNQTCKSFEVIVIDDGSSDNIAEVMARFPQARLIRQENRGVSTARNAGLGVSKGDYIVFLDADDRLRRTALEVGVNSLKANPQCAFVSGVTEHFDGDGRRLPTPQAGQYVQQDHYLTLLHRNYIWGLGSVMFRRGVFEKVAAFDESLAVCEDYDLYLRITRDFPVQCHGKTVLDYRQHSGTASGNAEVMLRTIVRVLNAHYQHVKGRKDYEQAYKKGLKSWKDGYGHMLVEQIYAQVRGRKAWKKTLHGLLAMTRYYQQGLILLMLRFVSGMNRSAPGRG